jgi:hypothetical protein
MQVVDRPVRAAKKATKKAAKPAAKKAVRKPAKEAAKKAAARPGPRADKADGEAAVRAKIAAMPAPNRAMTAEPPSRLIDARIEELNDWRGKTLSKIRAVIKQADPEVVEEWKWRGVPVWSHGGMICTGETYKNVVKITFAKGASLDDPSGLFNSSLEGNARRAIDFHEGDKIDETALKKLLRAAVTLNTSSRRG